MISNYDKNPSVKVDGFQSQCWTGWDGICSKINDQVAKLNKKKIVVVIECYHGILHKEIEPIMRKNINYSHFFVSSDSFMSEEEITSMVYPDVTDDSVFGHMTKLTIDQYFDRKAFNDVRTNLNILHTGIIIVYGEGASHLAGNWDMLVYADLARWEIQKRFRGKEISNLGINNKRSEFALQYKQAYFVDWRVCDRQKRSLLDRIDFLLDTNDRKIPKLVTGKAVNEGLKETSKRPFRVVPFFDPGPWGGQWMKEVCDLDRSAENYAWCFDCVPEENSLLLDFDVTTIEIPSINLVFKHPRSLLGDNVYEQFGREFPIRFDLLDTIEGGNLSLQVHPTKEYISEKFGMEYTQDESYYFLDAEDDAYVYLGLKEDIDIDKMIVKLKKSQNTGKTFDVDQFVAKWPIKKHDHVHIPAGTVHCSGKNGMVLEISATPYIFTFKLWDWGRLGLDGKPRPINIKHGEKVIDKSRTKSWVKNNIVNNVKKVVEGNGWEEEQTGLHKTQFIETRRHWFTKKVAHHTNGGVNVLNLIEGREVIIESPSEKFESYVVHYAETFIVPAAVGEYTIRPYGESKGSKCATIKAYVRVFK